MPSLDASLKTLALSVLAAAGGMVYAQGGDGHGADQWYSGQNIGFWGLSNSVGVRSSLPGPFNPPGSNPDSLSAIRQYGGYRLSDAFAIEGSQTQLRPKASACNGEPSAGDNCSNPAWSLSGIATLPFQSGLSLYGRLGLQYRQKGLQEDAGNQRNADDPGGIGKVYGIGLSYGLTKSITVHAESERYSELMGSNASSLGAGFGLDSSVHSIGLSIKF